jgi:hypothetical protein
VSITNVGTAVELNESASVSTRNITMPTVATGDGALLFLMAATANLTFTIVAAGLSTSFVAVGAAETTSGYTSQVFKITNLDSTDSAKTITIETRVSGTLTPTRISGGLRPYRGVHLTDIVDTYITKKAGSTTTPSTAGLTTVAAGCSQVHFVGMARGSTSPNATTLTVNTGQGVVDDFSAFTGPTAFSLSASAVAYDYTALAAGSAIGSKAFTADVAAQYVAWTISLRPGNLSPVVSAGTDQVVQAGATVSMVGTATDPDGTVASTVWSFNAASGSAYPAGGSAPSLTGGTTLTPTWTAPALAGDYILRLRVTDNNTPTAGVTDSYVTVTVTTTTSFPSAVISAGTFTNVGGAASIAAALSDSSDSTYAESAAGPSGDTLEVEHRPTPVGAKTVEYDLQSSAASPTTSWLVELMQGSTLIRSWTETAVGTTIIRRVRVLTSGENAAITDPTNLSMRYTVTED